MTLAELLRDESKLLGATVAEIMLAAAFAQAWHGVVEEDLVRRSRNLLRQRPWAVAAEEQ